MEAPETRFARHGDAYLAYQVLGDGPLDLLLVDTWVHHVEAVWDVPDFARFLRRLAAFGRLIHFDRRGTGLSDPVPVERLPDLDTQVADAVAVLDDAGSQRAALIGLNDGTLIAMLLAAAHPERVSSLVLWSVTTSHRLAAGMPMDSIDEVIEMIVEAQVRGDAGLDLLAPSRLADERFARQLLRLQRHAVSPGAIGHFYRQTMTASDVGELLPDIRVPSLVMNRTGNRIVGIELTREVAQLLPGARFVELPGEDHLVFSEGVDAVLDEIEEFLTGARGGVDPDRVLTTLMFTDIVGSTTRAAELGDRGWRDLLDDHHARVRAAIERFAGQEVSTTGDGFFATFDGPARAVRCARQLRDEVGSLGIQIRAGVHTGEVEVRGRDLGGLAVHIAARVAAAAGPGEVFVSSTVKELLAGSADGFEDAGEHELKGVPDRWRLYRAVP